MITWSLRTYLLIVLTVSATSAVFAYTGLYDIVWFVQTVSSYLAILSVTLIGFPLLAVPLMMQVVSTAIELVGEKPSQGLYRDFNVACLVVSLGSLIEIILLLLSLALREPNWIATLVSSLAFGNFIAFIIIFILVILLLQKIIAELEVAFTQ